jgi:type I restriction-modification system DNA methylase subunit
MATIDSARTDISQLVEAFESNKRFYLSPEYAESAARADFIDKFLEALGWDVTHKTQRNPFAQEVKIERTVLPGSQRKADYALFLAPNFRNARLFIEAKKPSSSLATADHYFQAARYGWNGNTSIAALTNFHEVHLVDCRFAPDIASAHTLGVRTWSLLHIGDDDFAEMYFLLSREGIAAGNLDTLTAERPKPRGKARQRGLFKGGYQKIDESFLAELDDIRQVLAKALKRENQELDGPALTEITQRIIDRLVFLRFLEDRGIEPHYWVSSFGSKSTAWRDFLAASRRLDSVYNGIVYKHHAIIDEHLRIDDEVFGKICELLSHLNSPYDFNAIPIHILGSIYERFLGKVITATEKRAQVENRPDVRHAEGVYYTPDYIVQYIVEHTLGQLIAGRSMEKVSEITVADLACGSGSFLLAIFDALLRHYTAYYNRYPKQADDWEVVEKDGSLHLTLRKRRQILVRHLFGIDIDPQAVEVAQLSLYLKLLEEETTGSAHAYQLSFREALLPPLTRNLISGNSLLSSEDIAPGLFDGERETELNPMDFAQRFPTIAKAGGFSIVVGNPPYVSNDTLPDDQKALYRAKFKTGKKFDLYQCFIEQGIRRLKPGGLLGMILPNTFLTGSSFEMLRDYLLKQTTIYELVDLPKGVFKNVAVDNVLLFLKNEPPPTTAQVAVSIAKPDASTRRSSEIEWQAKYTWPLAKLPDKNGNRINVAMTPEVRRACAVIEKAPDTLDTWFEVCDGITPCRTKADEGKFTAFKRKAGWHKLLRGRAVAAYRTTWQGEYIDYGPHLWRSRERRFFEQPKVLLHAIRNKSLQRRLVAALDSVSHFNTDNLVNVIARADKEGGDLHALLGILNSRAINFWYRAKYPNVNINPGELRTIPVAPAIFESEPLISAVREMISAKERLADSKTDRDTSFLHGKVESVQRKIDEIVYGIYEMEGADRRLIDNFFDGADQEQVDEGEPEAEPASDVG